jgi:predicted transcriptional regulator YdeE
MPLASLVDRNRSMPMEFRVVNKQQMLLVGLGFFGDPFRISSGWTTENEIGRLWQRYMAYLGAHPDSLQQVVEHGVAYEVHIQHEETPRTGEHEVFVGLEVAALEDVPVELSVKVLPPTTYAVFTLRGEQITSDWQTMLGEEWLPDSGYESDFNFGLQRYDERFKGVGRIDESVLELYVPVKPCRPST